MGRQSRLRLFLQKHYVASLVLAFLGGLVVSGSSHVVNRLIDRAAFDTEDQAYSVSDCTKYFPIEEGNTWVYEGEYEYTVPDSTEVRKTRVTLEMVVLRVHRLPQLTVAELSDWPFDYSCDPKPDKKSALVCVGSKIYRIEGSAAVERILSEEAAYGALTEADLMFEFPLCKDARYGETNVMAREDMWYLWHVEEELDVASSFYAGSKRGYRIAMRTLPGHAVLTFVPYLGILDYDYEHHGTVEKLSLRLCRFSAKSLK